VAGQAMSAVEQQPIGKVSSTFSTMSQMPIVAKQKGVDLHIDLHPVPNVPEIHHSSTHREIDTNLDCPWANDSWFPFQSHELVETVNKENKQEESAPLLTTGKGDESIEQCWENELDSNNGPSQAVEEETDFDVKQLNRNALSQDVVPASMTDAPVENQFSWAMNYLGDENRASVRRSVEFLCEFGLKEGHGSENSAQFPVLNKDLSTIQFPIRFGGAGDGIAIIDPYEIKVELHHPNAQSLPILRFRLDAVRMSFHLRKHQSYYNMKIIITNIEDGHVTFFDVGRNTKLSPLILHFTWKNYSEITDQQFNRLIQ
jgi:hypothetical protein